jgi:hypothetical protein
MARHGDQRSDAGIERTLPREQPAPKLEVLLHPNAAWWPAKFDQMMNVLLGQSTRRPEPVAIPDPVILRPMLTRCTGGYNETFDPDPAWRDIWGGDCERVQNIIRGLFRVCRDLRFPRPEQYEALVAALATHIVELHQAAAETQRELARKHAERQGPVARAQSAAALLEALPAFQAALLQFDAATRDAGGSRWHEVAYGLQHLEAAARRELS